VTAPDVVGDPETTWQRSKPVLQRLRALGVRAALVAQDGLEDRPDCIDWDAFDCLFIGGRPSPKVPNGQRRKPEWKDSPGCARLVLEALARGKYVHVGRVNSQRRYDHFAYLGVDSVDGTYLAFGPDVNLPKLQRWIAADLQEAA